jgi:hypothetical protein
MCLAAAAFAVLCVLVLRAVPYLPGFEDASGHSRGGLVIAVDDQGEAAENDITHVMVRLKAPELEIVDTLITAGIANSRAEAIRWALARISERPAYAQLREHTRDIQRLKTEF